MNRDFAERRRRVLVVDDEYVNRQMLGFILSASFEVAYAGDGAEALSMLREDPTYSLVMLDILMPVMNGFAFLEARQQDELLRTVPVIVLTSEKEAELRSLRLGAVDFITKPYDMPEIILARAERVVEMTENRNTIRETERDRLTGLYVTEYFYEYISQREKYLPGYGTGMDAAVLNIDRFHTVNEIFGRAFGDKVLKTAAKIISRKMGECGGIACRKEADWFYLYLPHREEYDSLVREMQKELAAEIPEPPLKLRMGICSGSGPELEIERRCDRAKVAGDALRNDFTRSAAWYDRAFHERFLLGQRLIGDLDRAVRERELKVLYQPKYDIRGNEPRLASAEALVRWEHPELGTLSPAVFMPVFEENGLVRRVDSYVWRETASQIRAWKETCGVTVPVSVNVSRIDLYSPQVFAVLTGILKEFGLTGRELRLEITESIYTENLEELEEKVRKLQDLGFRIEMDDFGSGYSSLALLKTLPVDALKLDRGLIEDIACSERSRFLVGTILELARYMGFETVAEGVEDEEQCRILKEERCDVIQGWYFSKPLTAEAFGKLIS